MYGPKVCRKKWGTVLILIFCSAFFSRICLNFNMFIVWGTSGISAMLFIGVGESLLIQGSKNKEDKACLLWGLSNILTIGTILFSLQYGSYVDEKNYVEWIQAIQEIKETNKFYEMSTLLLVDYLAFVVTYGHSIWKFAKREIGKWVPSFWYVMAGIGSVIYIKQEFDSASRIGTIIVLGLALSGYQIFKYISAKERTITYHFSVFRYLTMFVICTGIVVIIGISIKEQQELPGARWLRRVVTTLSGETKLQGKIPVEKHLNSDVTLSDTILFEIKASESLYLRDMAYKEYKDGVWHLTEDTPFFDSYIPFKSQYLKAEYDQLGCMLDEMAYQDNQTSDVLYEYIKEMSYEPTVRHKKQFTVIQNPINQINYFTVNGFIDIRDEAAEKLYYYQNINNCYFHSDKLIEPGQYTVEYYNHVPKAGSREYLFLRKINAVKWNKLYDTLLQNRKIYGYDFTNYPKLLLSYTPMIQYQNARDNFLQIPDNLIEPIKHLTETIVDKEESDWSNVEAICRYLKENYIYSIQEHKPQEDDPIYEFLYKTKEGICQEFATSMVLMCRSLGIPAKYVTGYLVTEKDDVTGNYIVREKDAHAFVEVYIVGYGWMSFDPTPTMSIEEKEDRETFKWETEEDIETITLLILILGILIIYKGGMIYLQEVSFKMVLRLSQPSKQIERIMKQTSKTLAKEGYERKNCETLSQYAKRMSNMGIHIITVVTYYETYKYGNQEVSKEQIQEAYIEYKVLKQKLRSK